MILVLGGPRFATLEVEIYNQTVSLFNLPLAAVLSLIQLGCTLALTVLYSRLNNRLSRPLSLRPQQLTQRRLPGRAARLLAGLYLVALLGLLTLPLLALITRSLIRFDSLPGAPGVLAIHPTLDYYRELAVNRFNSLFYIPPLTSIAISLSYATATVLLALSLGLPAAWALAHNRKAASSQLFEPLVMLPLGTSAVTLGLGFIVALDQPPLDLRASPLLIPLAHTLVAFPFVVRSLTPALGSIKPAPAPGSGGVGR